MGARRDYYALVAEDETGRRRKLVANYPREALLALAVELSSRWDGSSIDPDFAGDEAGKLAVGEDTEIPTDIRERIDPPRGTRLRIEPLGQHGVRITRPRYGLSGVGDEVALFLGVAALVGAIVLAVPPILGMNAGGLRIDRVLTWTGVGFLALLGVALIVVAV